MNVLASGQQAVPSSAGSGGLAHGDAGRMATLIRDHDWSGTPLGPIETWPAHLATIVSMMLDHGFPMIVLWGPELIQIYNDGYAEVLADKHPAALGMPTAACWPEVWHINGPIYERVWQGETVTFEDKCYPLARRGALGDAWFTLTYSPIRNPGGGVDGVWVTMVETTAAHAERMARQRAQDDMREAELRARTLVEGLAQAYWETDAHGRVVADSKSWRAYTGQAQPDYLGYGWIEAVHPDDRHYAESRWRHAVATLASLDTEFRLRHAATGTYRWTNVRAAPLLDEDGNVRKWVGMNIDIDDRKRAENALRESEQRLATAFRLLPVGVAIADCEGRVLVCNDRMRRYLPTGRVPALDPENAGRWRGWQADGFPIAPSDYAAMRALRGETVDPGMELLFTDDDGRESWTRVAAAPLHDAEGRINGALSIVMDIDELKRASQQLRANEERFRQFSAAASDVLWIRDAQTLCAEFLSPAFDAIYGLPCEEAMGDPRNWAIRVVPDDREAALARLREVAEGAALVHEFRIQRPDNGEFRWIRDTAFPLFGPDGRVRRVAGISNDVTETKRWLEHQGVLVAELQHRVRNIMAMIVSIVARTRKSARDVHDYEALVSGRLMSLARTQALLTRAENVGVCIRALINEELRAQAHSPKQFSLEGPDLMVPPKAAEVLSLALHELTTNALKYGALAQPDGHVAVTWSLDGDEPPWLHITWVERRAPPADWAPPSRRGFGTALVEERVPYELGGRGRLSIGPDGVQATIEFPLRRRDSILETDAPIKPGIAGGMTDMAGEPRLDGQRVLVVDDDFYLAHDAAAALRSAGARVLGPCGTVAEALRAMEAERPTVAVVDINLGCGPSYELMEALQSAGVPFVLVTGYDAAVVPAGLSHAPRLQKPVTPRQVVHAVIDALG